MPASKDRTDPVDWSLTTWEGSRREELRRWAQLPLERVVAALEEMQQINKSLSENKTTTEKQPITSIS